MPLPHCTPLSFGGQLYLADLPCSELACFQHCVHTLLSCFREVLQGGELTLSFLVCLLLQELGGSEPYGNPLCWTWFTELHILALGRSHWVRCSLVHDAGQQEGQGGGSVRMIS